MNSLSRLFPVVALTAACVVQAADFLDYPAALAEAKRTGKDIVLFEDGSDWVVASPALNKALVDPALRRALGDRVIWARHDNPDALPQDFKEPVKPGYAPWNLPALVVLDPEGHPSASAEGLRVADLSAVVQSVPGVLEKRARRDQFWKKAETLTGVERARQLGAGLDCLPFELAKLRRDIRDRIKQADPKDESGYTMKYDLDQSGVCAFHEGVTMKLIDQKKYDEVVAEADKRLANPVLTANQRQILMSARFQAYKARGDLPKALQELKAIAAYAPTTDMGRAAVSYYKAHTEPVRLASPAWRGDHNPPAWVPFVLDVSRTITAPGTYEIEFKHKDGHTRFRRVALVAGKTELVAEENAKESRKVRLTLAALPTEARRPVPLELRAEALGTGWYNGYGDIIITKVN